MVEHTPGPFAVHPTNAWIVCEQLDAHGQPCPVAALAWPTEYRTEAETQANGHLFAAAPELLAGCEKLLALVNRIDVAAWLACEFPAEFANASDVVGDVQAVIAKARGGRA